MRSYVTKPTVLMMPIFTSFFHAGQCSGSEAMSSLIKKSCSWIEVSAPLMIVPGAGPLEYGSGVAFSKSTEVGAVLATEEEVSEMGKTDPGVPEDMLCSTAKGFKIVSTAVCLRCGKYR